MSKTTFYILVAIAAILGIVGYLYTSHSGKELIRGFSEALLVAVFLALTVDVFVKSRLSQEISHEVINNVAMHLFAYGLPRSVIDEAVAIRDIRLYVTKLQIGFTLTPTADRGLYTLTIHVQYDVRNRTDSEQRFIHAAGCVRSHPENTIKRLGAGNMASGQDYKLDETEITKYLDDQDSVTPTDRPDVAFDKKIWRGWKKELIIPPQTNEGAHAPHFWSEVMLRTHASGYHPHYFREPTEGVEVQIRAPEDIEMNVIFGRRYTGDPPHTVEHASDHKTIRSDAAFLPGQSVLAVWWKKSEEQA